MRKIFEDSRRDYQKIQFRVVNYFTGFNYELNGLSIVVSEREGETDEEISFTYNPNQLVEDYTLDYFRYIQYVRLKTTADPPGTTGIVLDEVEVYAFSEYHCTHCYIQLNLQLFPILLVA